MQFASAMCQQNRGAYTCCSCAFCARAQACKATANSADANLVQVLFKMDKLGEGQEVVAADLAQNRDPSFIGFTHQMFLEVGNCSLTLCAAQSVHCHVHGHKGTLQNTTPAT